MKAFGRKATGVAAALMLVQGLLAPGVLAKGSYGAPYEDTFTASEGGTPDRCTADPGGAFAAELTSLTPRQPYRNLVCQAGLSIELMSPRGGVATFTWQINEASGIGEYHSNDASNPFERYLAPNGPSICMWSDSALGCQKIENMTNGTVTTQIGLPSGHTTITAYVQACVCGTEAALPQKVIIDANLVGITVD